MAESGSHTWEYVLTFTEDFRFIQSGMKYRTLGDGIRELEICALDEEGKSLTPETQYKLYS